MKYNNGLFVFRRDLRIVDNHGLLLANSICNNIFTIFIFTPEQVSNSNDYKSNNAIQFMIESLKELSSEISKKGGRLYTFYGNNINVIKKCLSTFQIDCVCFNKDYTPYAIERDTSIVELCKSNNVICEISTDYYLYEPGTIFSSSGKEPYKKFTPYYEECKKHKVDLPVKYKAISFSKKNVEIINSINLNDALKKFIGEKKENLDILVHGGRNIGLIKLNDSFLNQKKYIKTRNELDKKTSQLSAYIKFGCISIREVYSKFKNNHEFIRQLMWRDFYANILYYFPFALGKSIRPNYNKIKWKHNKDWLELWKNGMTGFPLVDAGMRELNRTGYMHNRARLITSSFLVKTLLIDWRYGEKYFARKLTDYDPASNNGNWQWIAGGGADSMPYFRIFNPWQQSKENDTDAKYIKKWINELEEVPANDIHRWYDKWENYKDVYYPKPMVEYDKQKKIVIQAYNNIF
jgi:deoxyribodipyrimidine photo-lyase